MQFVLMIYHGPTPSLPGSERWKAMPEAEQQQVYADYGQLNSTEGLTPGLPLGLANSAKTVRVHDGVPHVQDGPYETEAVGGYYVLEAESMEAAILTAEKIPAARLGGAVEIRPAAKYW